MSIDNLPNSEKDAVDIIAKAGYLKASNDKVEISLESSDTINIQPKGNIFGAKLKVEENGTITPTLTFDTKKLWNKNDRIDVEGTIDDALKDFWEDENV
jgi:hypothetical protein